MSQAEFRHIEEDFDEIGKVAEHKILQRMGNLKNNY